MSLTHRTPLPAHVACWIILCSVSPLLGIRWATTVNVIFLRWCIYALANGVGQTPHHSKVSECGEDAERDGGHDAQASCYRVRHCNEKKQRGKEQARRKVETAHSSWHFETLRASSGENGVKTLPMSSMDSKMKGNSR